MFELRPRRITAVVDGFLGSGEIGVAAPRAADVPVASSSPAWRGAVTAAETHATFRQTVGHVLRGGRASDRGSTPRR